MNNFDDNKKLDDNDMIEDISKEEPISNPLFEMEEVGEVDEEHNVSKDPFVSQDKWDDRTIKAEDKAFSPHFEASYPTPIPVETQATYTEEPYITFPQNEYVMIPEDINFPSYHRVEENIKPQKKPSRFKRNLLIGITAIFIGAMSIGLGTIIGIQIAPKITKNAGTEATNEAFSFDKQSADPLEFHENTFQREGYAELIDKVEPYVVSLYATKEAVSGQTFSFPYQAENSSGSGIIFHEDEEFCYVVTNSHVIDKAKTVSVSVSQASPVESTLVGKDEKADLAVLSLKKSDLQSVGVLQVTLASFGNSDSMRVGDFVLAIGNSMGEGNTATNGIISARDKIIKTDKAELEVLQTNAAINPGNSGGPLINLDGEVIGITTSKMTNATVIGGSLLDESKNIVEGMGYAIPSNIAMEIIEALMSGKKKAALGVSVSNITEEFAAQYNLPQAGALVLSVTENSAADKAGVLEMDIITGFNGQSIITPDQLVEAVSDCEVGDTVEVKIITIEGELKTVQVTLEEAITDTF